MKSSQMIVVVLAGVATAVGVAVATIQVKTSTPETNNSHPSPSQPFQTSQTPKAQPTAAQSPTRTPEFTPTQSPIPTQTFTSQKPAKPGPVAISPPTEGCKISMAVVSDPNPPLNVRSSPKVAGDNVVDKLNNGTFVSIIAEENGWFQISEPKGWIAKNRTENSCSLVNERIIFPPKGDSAIVKGRIIGGGSHSYVLQASAGQLMRVKSLSSDAVFPNIMSPNNQVLASETNRDGNKKEWRGKLPVSGDYTFQFDSNYKGFGYEFLVEVQ